MVLLAAGLVGLHCAKNWEFVLLHSDLSFLTYEFGLESLLVKVKWISRSQSWEGSIPNLARPILCETLEYEIRAPALELFHGFRPLSASLFPELSFAQQNMMILFSVWHYEMPNTPIVTPNIISLFD